MGRFALAVDVAMPARASMCELSFSWRFCHGLHSHVELMLFVLERLRAVSGHRLDDLSRAQSRFRCEKKGQMSGAHA